MMRDRAMALLAAEGIRPGALGNFTIDDFRFSGGDLDGYIVVKDNVPKRGLPVSTAIPKAKGTRSIKQNYIKRVTMRLWPFTCVAIKDYIDGERSQLLGRRLENRSKSFLFLADHGGPIENRTTITSLFRSLRTHLRKTGLLRVARGDPFVDKAHYDFDAYALRHSAATFFYANNAHRSEVLDLMRQRFGWAENSVSPRRYANRAMSESASVDMHDFHQNLLEALAAKRDSRSAEQ